MNIIAIVKTVLTYFFNFFEIFKIKEVGKSVYIGKGLRVKAGDHIQIKNNVRIGINARLSCFECENGWGGVIIERNCYIVDYFTILSGGLVSIGHDTLIASNVSLVSENHGINPECGVRYGNQPLSGNPIIIGNNCWIGEKVMILPGVTIGEWSIIGAGSVVTKDIPKCSIAVGNPAKVIKAYNFETHKWESLKR